MNVDTGWDAEGQGSIRTRVITNASLRGTGIHIRPSTTDTEDDIDIDGTDEALFGDAQFGEADVDGQRSNHDRQSEGTTPTDSSDKDMDKSDLAILTARSRGDNPALILALEAKLDATVSLAFLTTIVLFTVHLVACASDLSDLSVIIR